MAEITVREMAEFHQIQCDYCEARAPMEYLSNDAWKSAERCGFEFRFRGGVDIAVCPQCQAGEK